MKKRSTRKLLAMLEDSPMGDTEKKGQEVKLTPKKGEGSSVAENSAENVAERVGRALLDRLGNSTGLSEEELAEHILKAWEARPNSASPILKADKAAEQTPIRSDELAKRGSARRRPTQERGTASSELPTDYSELSEEQFRKLKKQLQRASANGKRIRL